MSTSAIQGLMRTTRGLDQAAARIAAGSIAPPAQAADPGRPIGRDRVDLVLYERRLEASARVVARTEQVIGGLLDVIV